MERRSFLLVREDDAPAGVHTIAGRELRVVWDDPPVPRDMNAWGWWVFDDEGHNIVEAADSSSEALAQAIREIWG